MKRILLNTALATVLYLSNTTYASDIDQDEPLKTLPHMQPAEPLPDDIIAHTCRYLPLEDLMNVIRASKICRKIINDRVGPQKYPEFFHLYKAMRTGSWEFKFSKLHDCFPDIDTNTNRNDGIFVSKMSIPQYPTVYFRGPGNDKKNWTELNSIDGKTYHGSKRDKGRSQAYVMVVDLKSQPSELMENTTGIKEAWVKDNQQNKIPITVQSFQFLQHPTDITYSVVRGQSANGQFSFGLCRDARSKDFAFRSTSEKGLKKIMSITENTPSDIKTHVAGLTNSAQIMIGYSWNEEERVAGMWVGEEESFVPVQKFLKSGLNPMPDGTSVYELEKISADGKRMMAKVFRNEEVSYVVITSPDE